MNVATPRQFEGSCSEALAHAAEAVEPLFLPVGVHVDDRGWSIMNQLQGVMTERGQINFSVQHPGVIKAWHRHAKQTDFWLCLSGHLKAGVYRESDGAAWSIVLGEMRPGVLVVPPPLWHGAATVGDRPSGLLYYVTHAYDPAAPDEERKPWNAFEGFPWELQHR
jgi:dTDP-4-dehydrorhamnose 3,5-epimerase